VPQPLPPQAPAHWSKDFVEHLRTVHFALIAVSAGLILLVLLGKQYNPVAALVQIEEILDIQARWSPTWIENHAHKIETYHNNSAYLDGSTYFYVPYLNMEMRGIPIPDNAVLNAHLVSLSGRVTNLRCHLPAENWIIVGTRWDPKYFPGNLRDFKIWWDSTKTGLSMKVPIAVVYHGTTDRPHDASLTFANFISRPGSATEAVMDLEEITREDEPWAYYTVYFEPGSGIDEIGTIEVVDMTQYTLSQESISSAFSNLNPGSFESSFSALSVAAQNYMDLPFTDTKEFLHDEAAKGQEVFEAFGMKFPAGKITLWGTILIVSVQLYFLVYLRQLSGKLNADDPGWDVPWVGMDTTFVSQMIMFATVILLPIVAVALLDYQTLKAKQLLSDTIWLRRTEYTGLVTALVTSICFGILSWHYRPKLEPQEPPTPTPLFY
jgi:hypothetical protein